MGLEGVEFETLVSEPEELTLLFNKSFLSLFSFRKSLIFCCFILIMMLSGSRLSRSLIHAIYATMRRVSMKVMSDSFWLPCPFFLKQLVSASLTKFYRKMF